MQVAVDAVVSGKMRYLKAAKESSDYLGTVRISPVGRNPKTREVSCLL